jgi:neutral ceramidase
MSIRTICGIAPAILLLLCPLPCLAAETWKAGAAQQKITPEQPMWMAGYGSRNHPSTGFLNDLWVKVLVLEDPRGARVAMVGLDLVGIGPDITEPVLAELKKQHDLSASNVALFCSHTHSGPVVGRNLRSLHFEQVDEAQRQRIDDYAQRLRQSIVTTVDKAVGALQPSQLSYGQGTARFATNRRNNKEADVPRLRAENKLQGPFDHDVPVLKVADSQGKVTAVLFGYACHATVLGDYDWSSDYPGFAQSALQERHPGCTAVFFAGCGADQNPLPRRKVKLAKQYGNDLADSVDAVLATPLTPVTGNLQTAATKVDLSLSSVPSREQVEQDAKSSDKFVAARAKHYLRLLDEGKSIPAGYSYPIQLWRLGDKLTLVTLGGEVVVDYAVRLKQELGPGPTWVAGYANDVMAYIPSRRVLLEGGYEGGGAMVYYGLPSPWTPTVEEDIVRAVHGLAESR